MHGADPNNPVTVPCWRVMRPGEDIDMTELKAKVQEGQQYAGLTPFVFLTKSITLMGHLSVAADDYLLIQGERQVHRRLMGAERRNRHQVREGSCVLWLPHVFLCVCVVRLSCHGA